MNDYINNTINAIITFVKEWQLVQKSVIVTKLKADEQHSLKLQIDQQNHTAAIESRVKAIDWNCQLVES